MCRAGGPRCDAKWSAAKRSEVNRLRRQKYAEKKNRKTSQKSYDNTAVSNNASNSWKPKPFQFVGKLARSEKGPDGGWHHWLEVDGVIVSYAKVYDKGDHVELCDIETREGYRNKGYATQILRQVAREHGQTEIIHNGGYTPDGAAFLKGKVKRSDDYPPGSFEPMSFVHDWDSMERNFV